MSDETALGGLGDEVETKKPVNRRENVLEFLHTISEPQDVMGCLVKPVDGTGFARMRTLQAKAISGVKGDDRLSIMTLAEDASLLTVCVVDPVLTFDEWMFELGRAEHSRGKLIVDAVRAISDLDTDQTALAKKVLREMQSTTTNSTSA
jgi:hypothetical protein